ncbi:MAG: ATP-dependent DNA helicase [Bergeyella sp.]|nr:ATP-dependent DNA helicase [Bergeyella sp.]
MDYLKGLNPSQYEAVTTLEGPLMVLAGAGSGKTRVLTMRIAHLITHGVDPFHILSLTFTNKAAREMKDRISKVVGESNARSIWMGTFHSVFARILRQEAAYLGYPSNFTIYDTQDALSVLKKIIKETRVDPDLYKPKRVLARISNYKNNLITVKAYFNTPELMKADEKAHMKDLGTLYHKYVEICFRNGAMDFDDLLLRTNELLTRFPEVLARYQDKFRYILVDEYQDTNHSQYLIVKALASKFENVCVVGDDAQSIYSFRGANIQNILNFKKDYPDAMMVALEQNYRSTQNIVNAANQVISRNTQQFEKNIFSNNEVGEKIKVYRALSDADEANFVASNIWELHNREQRRFNDFAILYRTNSQTRAFEDALRKKNIPYRVYGGLSFYQRKEVKDLLAYLRVLVNENDTEALLRIINYPARGIGETTQNKLIVFADQKNLSLSQILDDLGAYSGSLGLNNGILTKIHDFWMMIKAFGVLLKTENAYQVAMEVAKRTGLIRFLKEEDQSPEGISRIENVQELMNSIQGFIEEQQQLEDGDPSLLNFLGNIALSTDQDKIEEGSQDRVSLMTIHLSKGLEFPVVNLVGLEESLFPSFISTSSREDLEEERRLFYVALTRAEKQVFLSYAVSRFRWGKITDAEPSRFLSEIESTYLDFMNPSTAVVNNSGLKSDIFGEVSAKPRGKVFNSYSRILGKKSEDKKKNYPKKLMPVASANIKSASDGSDENIVVGDRVRHDRFGVGEVLRLDGTDLGNIKAKVLFQHEGEKNLILKFAKLTKL